MDLSFGTACSGIEAASIAWGPLGFKPVWFSEIDKFACAVLQHHWPHILNIGDMIPLPGLIELGVIPAPDIFAAGTPCQSFSIGGEREGLNDPRGQLTLKYAEVCDAIDNVRAEEGKPPGIFLWENVPGVLNDKTNAFGCLLGALAGGVEHGVELKTESGRWPTYGCVFGRKRTVAWRVLDAQYFGVAQRRRRVFLVSSARKDCNPAQVLFEFEGLRRSLDPFSEKKKNYTGNVEASFGAEGYRTSGAGHWSSGVGPFRAQDGSGWDNLIVSDVCPPLNAGGNSTGGNRFPGTTVDTIESLIIHRAFAENSRGELRLEGGDGFRTGAISTGGGKPGQGYPAIFSNTDVRRLMPPEVARLQAFPHDHCKIPYRGRPAEKCADGPQYKAYGNSMATVCMQWIGKRIIKAIEKPWSDIWI